MLSTAEVRARAAAFAREWQDAHYERGDTQTFYNEFFEVFGMSRKRLASFEEPVKRLGDKRGFLDLFWKGKLLVEQKSAGRSLVKAKTQALAYFPMLRDEDLPRYLLVCDFQNFELHDLEAGTEVKFKLADLPKHIKAFDFIRGLKQHEFKDQDPVNIKAAELVGKLHDALEASDYTGHDLERFLVRLVFCLFADDTGIFETGIFLDLIERTRDDGSDTGHVVNTLFDVLNTQETKRQKTLGGDFEQFPYVNGGLFEERLRPVSFDGKMRAQLLDACRFDWSAISPAIFGSLFQSVMDSEERRNLGAHYTSEKNILKVIKPLFVDELRAEFAKLKSRKDSRRGSELKAFQERLSKITFFDPACGCGNFLVIAYREIRDLEIEVIREIRVHQFQNEQGVLDTAVLSLIDVDQFYGIEIDEFPAKIAETALWMMDHIMNNRLSLEFGQSFVRIPLKKSPHIVVENALSLDWETFLPSASCFFIFGNPPFRGHQWRSSAQQADMSRIWGTSGQFNRLDYVTCWFKKAKEYAAQNTRIDIAFVATNSITQGEQCGILWPVMLSGNLTIRFAHRTFQWNNEARGKAAVHCVIIGMTFGHPTKRMIFEYEHVRGEPHMSEVSRINGYLIDAPQYAVPARTQPPPTRLKLHKGSQPTDGARLKQAGGGYITTSNLILEESDRAELLAVEPKAERWLKPYVGGDELISGQWRWCLWLKDANPSDLRNSKAISERLDRVRQGRLKSPTPSVRAFAKFPTLFTQDRQPDTDYLAIPEVSSETREYIPIAQLPSTVIASNKLQIIPGAPLYYFGVLTSAMHMAWMRTVAGRLESRYSYAPAVYNSFPWPEMTPAQEHEIESHAQAVIDARSMFSESTLDDLYDADGMPPVLRRAHNALDRAVDRLYRRAPFKFERERVEYLFALYEKLSAPLAPMAEKKAEKRRKTPAAGKAAR